MRIISGALRGKQLVSFKGKDIRPTSDRIKESIFNILGDSVQDRHVLDLYAGTGNLSLEALSRGAASAVLIDGEKQSLSIIQRNIGICRLQAQTRTMKWDIRKNLNCIDRYDPPFDLVFMDPPYGIDLVLSTLTHLHQSHSLAPNARIVIEHPMPFTLPADLEVFRMADHRKYGKTLVSFLNCVV